MFAIPPNEEIFSSNLVSILVIVPSFYFTTFLFLIYQNNRNFEDFRKEPKMATADEKAQCVQWFIQTKSDTQTRRNFRNRYGRDPPSRSSIRAWYDKFLLTGSLLDKRRSGRPKTPNDSIRRVRETFTHSPTISIRASAKQLLIPRSTVHKILRKNLKLYPYKLQLVQALEPNDRPRRTEFAFDMLEQIAEDPNFLNLICFSDEATFHVSGKVNKHNTRIWGSEQPYVFREIQRDSPKLNVWCGVMRNRIIGPFFFAEKTITAAVYLDLLTEYVAPQLADLQPTVMFQQDGAPPHWGLRVREFLNETFPGRWIGRGGPILWPPRSPDITPLDFFLWGYVKDIVYKTQVQDINDLRNRITGAIATIDEAMLRRTWRELDFRLDLLFASNGDHVKVL